VDLFWSGATSGSVDIYRNGVFFMTRPNIGHYTDNTGQRGQATFTYTATFHIPAGTAGGTIQFLYTWNNGHASPSASVTVPPGQSTATYTFTSSGTLYVDHTYPGIAEVLVNSPNAVNSPQVKPSGTCS